MKINRIAPESSFFLKRLQHIANAPDRLYYIGKLPSNRQKVVSIVGTRRPTAYGRTVAEHLAGELASRGVVIVSGLALGIDSVAHRAALRAGGRTVAVLPSGPDIIYPYSHRGLARDIIVQDGAIVSEYDPGTPPLQFRFLERNRIVSGLADILVVVEAAARSGTLSTVTHALDQGVEVYAVPGNITSPLSSGCNMLLRQGAHPLVNIDDFIDTLGLSRPTATAVLGDTPEETTILQLLGQGIQDGDALLSHSALEPALFGRAMTMLEIKGNIKPLGGNQWRI